MLKPACKARQVILLSLETLFRTLTFMTSTSKQKIAIIGTGISGLGAAHLLHPHRDIVVYEKNNYAGGHSRTVDVKTENGVAPVDTGFIVFNERNYPLLTRLFKHLQVPTVHSDMSFGASVASGWLEYGTRRSSDLFAQKRNILRPAYWAMLRDILHFNQQAKNFLNRDPSFTLAQCLDELNMGTWFRNYYLLAMGACIWSTPLDKMLEFPAASFIRFFDNHGLLSINDHPQWLTVKGGSREYVKRIVAPFKEKIQLNCGVAQVERRDDGVLIHDTRGNTALYDQVIFACHSDQALALIKQATAEEYDILRHFKYQANRMVLHSDTRFMPTRKNAWASWVYLSEQARDRASAVSLSYWMNNLQALPTQKPIFVTLNPAHEPKKDSIYDEHVFDHPVFDADAIRMQEKIKTLQGKNRFWFCGAYQRHGFHEDGLASAVNVVERMGIAVPWK